MPFPLQDAERDQTAGEVMYLSLLRACWTATQLELIFTDPERFCNLGAEAIQPADLGSRQRETIGGKVLGAVSDDQDFQATAQPFLLRPIGGGADRPGGAAR